MRNHEKINLLILIDILYKLGGSERNLLQLVKHLDKAKFSVMVCPLEPEDSPIIQEIRKNGGRVIPLPLKRFYGISGLKQGLRLRKIIRENNIDIIQTIHFASDALGAFFGRISEVAAIVSSRRDMGFREGSHLHKRVRRITNSRIDKIIAVSDKVRHLIHEKENVATNKIMTVYNSVNLEDYKNLPANHGHFSRYGLDFHKPIVGTVANLRPIKGLEYFIKAAATVVASNSDTQFVIVGDNADGDPRHERYYQHLLALRRQLNIEKNLFFLGYVENAVELIAMMDIFVLSSLSEGFSNSILEAMACQKPVIATEAGGNSEAVVNGQTGCIVPPKNAEAIAQAIVRLLEHPKLAKQMGELGRRRIEKHFSTEVMIRTLEDLYCALAPKAADHVN